MRLPFILTSLVLLAACEGSTLSKDQVAVRQSVSTAATTEPVASADAQDITIEGSAASTPMPVPVSTPAFPPNAVPPVSIGGAFLTCVVTDPSVAAARCNATTYGGKPYVFAPEKAFFTKLNPISWQPATFKVAGTDSNSWIVMLPEGAGITNFAISLVSNKQESLATWNVKDSLLGNLVRNGSFEDVLMVPADRPSRYPFETPEFKWAFTAQNGCKTAYLEIVNSQEMSGGIADKNQAVELDSTCSVTYGTDANGASVYTGGAGGQNVIISQNVKVQEGRYYELSFKYLGRSVSNVNDLSFYLNVSGQAQKTFKATLFDRWYLYKAVFKAEADSVEIKFQEAGVADGRGMILDDVIVRDLGKLPSF